MVFARVTRRRPSSRRLLLLAMPPCSISDMAGRTSTPEVRAFFALTSVLLVTARLILHQCLVFFRPCVCSRLINMKSFAVAVEKDHCWFISPLLFVVGGLVSKQFRDVLSLRSELWSTWPAMPLVLTSLFITVFFWTSQSTFRVRPW